jgi:hypothetical protein
LQLLGERSEGGHEQRTIIQLASAVVVVEDAVVSLAERGDGGGFDSGGGVGPSGAGWQAGGMSSESGALTPDPMRGIEVTSTAATANVLLFVLRFMCSSGASADGGCHATRISSRPLGSTTWGHLVALSRLRFPRAISELSLG